MKNLCVLVAVLLLSGTPVCSQTNLEGKVLRWDTEAYGKHGHVTRNAAIYYIQIDKTVYRVTRGTTKPDSGLAPGQQVKCRIEKENMFIPGEKSREVKYSIIGEEPAQ